MNYEDEKLNEIFANAKIALRRLIDLLELAQIAKTKEEAEQFIKELRLADCQVSKCLSPGESLHFKDIKLWIKNGHGDFAKLTKLYISLGAV